MTNRLDIHWRRSVLGLAVTVATALICTQHARGQVAYEVLHGFTNAEPGPGQDGTLPEAGLVQAIDGSFYGTTAEGGTAGFGTVFKITPAGTFTTLHSFDGSDGAEPSAALIQASDGNLYGTTVYSVFKITTADVFTRLNPTSGGGADLIQASDADLYGTTFEGGANGGGSVYRITVAGAFTTLHSFELFDSASGNRPRAGLIQASDGAFYGTTFGPSTLGPHRCGTVFKITSAGILTTLHAFNQSTDGCSPWAGLIEVGDGTFYGTTFTGGTVGGAPAGGTIFKITAAGTLSTVHAFDCSTEGCLLIGGRLFRASDGNFYGTTTAGGPIGGGTVFKLTASGSLTTFHEFDCSTEGCGPRAGLIQASDGNLYGTTASLGPRGGGSVFRLVGRVSGPARVWIGLKNSDEVGLRLDLLAEVFVDGTKIGEGRVSNVDAGSSGFNNAVLNSIPLALSGGPVDFPVFTPVEVKLSVRRTCSGGGHASGIARLWYNGQPIDSGANRDAGSRLDVVSGGATTKNLLRSGFALSTARGTAKQAIDVSVDSKQSCPDRAFKPFGTWGSNP